jgi:predicted DNA-binding transcriptional regulator AlpA
VASSTPVRLLNRNQLLKLVGVSYGSVYEWSRRGQFPAAIEIGPGGRTCRIAWVESEIFEWLANRPRRQTKPPCDGETA